MVVTCPRCFKKNRIPLGVVTAAATSEEGAEALGEYSSRVIPQVIGAPGERNSRVIPNDVKIQVSIRDQGRCVQCRSTEDLHFDHKIPYSRGGSNTVNNIQLMCGPCNRAKGARLTDGGGVGPLDSGIEPPEPERAPQSESQLPVPERPERSRRWAPKPGWGTVRRFDREERSYWFVFDDGNQVGPCIYRSADDPHQQMGEYARGTLVLPEGLKLKVPVQLMRQMEEVAKQINGFELQRRMLVFNRDRQEGGLFAGDKGWAWTPDFTLVKAAPGLRTPLPVVSRSMPHTPAVRRLT